MPQISPGNICAVCMNLIAMAQEICIICRTYKEYKKQARENESIKAKCAKLHIDLTPATSAKH
ncbi:hypothetical protein HMPREF9435_1076 [Gardnerella vaginalis 315-A]|nr:hypothetical protein HMPREF9435_1076 [Gardnerella vaginalis 315-A]